MLPVDVIATLQTDPFFGTAGSRKAKVMFVFDSWLYMATAHKKLFNVLGDDSYRKEFDRIIIETGLSFDSVFVTAALPYHLTLAQTDDQFKGDVGKWGAKITPLAQAGLSALQKQIAVVNPDVIIAMGNVAFWSLCAEAPMQKMAKKDGGSALPSGITDWRGSMLWSRFEYGNRKVIPTLPLDYIFRQWSTRVYVVHDIKARRSKLDSWNAPAVVVEPTPSFERVMEFLQSLLDSDTAKPLVCDIETKRKNITCIGFATSKSHALCIPLVKLSPQRLLESWWTPEQELPILRLLRRVMLSAKVLLIGQNFLYDMQYLSCWLGLPPKMKCFFDTMYAHHTLFPGTDKGLDVLSSMYCEHHVFWKHETQEWQETGTVEQLLMYNCTDCLRTFEIYEVLQQLIKQMQMVEQYAYMQSITNVVYRMMMRGIKRDWRKREALGVELLDVARPRERYLEAMIPQHWIPNKQKVPWYRSPAQQKTLFYEVLGLTEVRHRKTKAATMNDEALNSLKKKYPALSKVFNTLADLRSIKVFDGLFVRSWDDPDGRFRASFNPAGTETFRFSSSKNAFHRGGNLQNVSSGDE